MNVKQTKNFRVLAIAPYYRGFGYALLDGPMLADSGVKVMKKANHAKCLLKIEKLMALYHPDVLALEDFKQSQRSERIRDLVREAAEVAAGRNIRVKVFTRGQVYVTFCDGRRSKDALAEAMAARFPGALSFRIPPKKQAWTSEDYRMVIFEAVAFGLMVQV